MTPLQHARRASCVAACAALFFMSSGLSAGQAGSPSAAAAPTRELWADPGEVGRRDALNGPGGPTSIPGTANELEVVGVDNTGYSGGFTVVDGERRRWDVKIGPEGQPEVVANRVLWLVGYHQPVVHFVTSWRRKGDALRPQLSGRFRLQSDHETEGEWAWRDNPFVGSRALKGLVVVNLLLNNWDFKTSNNRIYTIEGNGGGPRRWFVVQDLGASLGRSGWPHGNRNDVDAFESQRFVKPSGDGGVTFDYKGRHREVLEDITPADVIWTCRLVSRITDRQWKDIFRAAAYPDHVSERYRKHLAFKIAEGLALEPPTRRKP